VIRGAVREVEQEWTDALGADDVEQLRALLLALNATLTS
jgi:hypothetical protein